MKPDNRFSFYWDEDREHIDRSEVIGMILIAVAILLFVLGVIVAFVTHAYSTEMAVAEYEAQIAANGIYKEDLHILNQIRETKIVGAVFTFGILSIILSAIPGAIGIIMLKSY